MSKPAYYPFLDASIGPANYFPQNIVMQTGGYIYRTAVDALTAFAGGGQTSATPLTAQINRVTTVATGADSVLLPPAVAGMQVVVVNAAAANSMNVFPSSATQGGVTGGDAINALSQNSALAVAANKTVVFNCAVTGTWNSILTA